MIRGTKRPVLAQRRAEHIALMAKIHNRWDVEVVDAATGEVKQRARGFNVICANWWLTAYPYLAQISYGSGTGTPAPSDTTLFHYEGYKNIDTALSSTDATHLAEGYYAETRGIQLQPADAVGVTLTELGWKYTSGSDSAIMTHAMLQDMNGNPVSIEKTATDIIRITSTIFYHFQAAYQNGRIRLTEGLNYIVAALAGRSSILAYAMTAAALGGSSIQVDSAAPWTPENKTISYKISRVEAGSLNAAGGIPYLAATIYGAIFNYDFLLFLPDGLSEITGEAVGTGDGTTTDFPTAFALPRDATIYVDGVEQLSGVIVVPDIPGATNLNAIVRRLSLQATAAFPLLSTDTGNNIWFIDRGATALFENLHSDVAPMTEVSKTSASSLPWEIYASDDLSAWTLVGSATSQTVSVPAALQGSKYWKIVNGNSNNAFNVLFKNTGFTGFAVRFDAPPAAGAIITADYKTPMIPKDSNHIIDFGFSLTFGDYEEE